VRARCPRSRNRWTSRRRAESALLVSDSRASMSRNQAVPGARAPRPHRSVLQQFRATQIDKNYSLAPLSPPGSGAA
jgi:hypothetical protein